MKAGGVMVDGETTAAWHIRAGRDSDGTALIALIWACWSAYPGVRMDVDAEMPELHALATYYGARVARCGSLKTLARWWE